MHIRIHTRAHTHIRVCVDVAISHQQKLHPNIDYNMYNQTTQPAARCKYETQSTLILHLSKKLFNV